MLRHPFRPLPRPAALLAGAAAALVAGAPALAEGGIEGFREKMSKWVETRRLISAEQSDWAVEEETLRSTRDLLREQVDALQEEIADLEESNTQADKERRELLLKRGEYQRARRSLEEQVLAMEEEVRAVAPSLPEPLRERLESLLVQIPDDPENTRVTLGRRLVNVLGVLIQAEKFNDTATLVGETRAVQGDQKVQVRTLYWGLGQAFYAAANGQAAGTGHPDGEGWVFQDQEGVGDEARLLLDIYEGNVDVIRFVELPVEIH